MTTYVLSLTGDEEKAANATHWAKFRKAKFVSISRDPGPRPPANAPGQDGMRVVLAHFDCEDYAADVVARIAALGREVVCSGKAASHAFSAGVRPRSS